MEESLQGQREREREMCEREIRYDRKNDNDKYIILCIDNEQPIDFT